jgi:hypothetical protein
MNRLAGSLRVQLYASEGVLRRWRGLSNRPSRQNTVIGDRPSPAHSAILAARQYEALGSFRRLLPLEVPSLLTFEKVGRRIVSYALCVPLNSRCFGYTPERTGAHCLGFVGVWTDPAFRNRGYARRAMRRLGAALKPVPKDKYYLLSEERILGMQKLLPLIMLPRRACDQPSRERIVRMLRDRSQPLHA